MGFQNDLAFGQKYESWCRLYEDFDRVVTAPNTAFKDWDFYITKGDKKTAFEVKACKMAKRTGNLAIEFRSRNIDSGINATKADYWYYCVVIDDKKSKFDLYKFPVNELKQLIKTENCRVVRGCENGKNEMYLLKKNRCDKYLVKREIKTTWPKIYFNKVLNQIDKLPTISP